MKVWQRIGRHLELTYESTSLDFPCNFCDSNSYKNYHLKIGTDLINICEDCLNKSKKEYDSIKEVCKGEERK